MCAYKRISPIPVVEGGTSLQTITAHDLIVGNGTGTPALLAPSATAGIAVVSAGAAADPVYGTVVVGGGGTGATTLTGVLIGNGTSAVTGNAVTQYNTLVGGASNAISSIAPSATSGVPYISQGAASNPAFGTAVVAGGGTGQTSLTAHDVLVGNGTSAVTLVAPSSTSGVPFISQGASADPTYGTAVVAGGGTGNTTFTAYSVICAGTTATGAFQNVSGLGTAGQVLTSNDSGALPSWQDAAGGSGITQIDGNSGTSVTDSSIFITIDTGEIKSGGFTGLSSSALLLTLVDSSNNLFLQGGGATGSGGTQNIIIGNDAASGITTSGDRNIVMGYFAGASLTSGADNVVMGSHAGDSSGSGGLSTGSNNVIIGNGAASGGDIAGSSNNIMIGTNAGSTPSSAISNNIYLNSSGGAESNRLRIGNATGTGTNQLNASFIAGITGITVTGTAVLVSTSNQLGVAASSAKFKKDIKDMSDSSSDIYKLRPVTFVWNKESAEGLKDATDDRQFGLIAEEVDKIMPSLVVMKDKAPFSVRYENIIPMLLNELQKLQGRIKTLEQKLGI